MHLRRIARTILAAAVLAAAPVLAAEIDLHLTTTLPGVNGVRVDVVPTQTGPTSSLEFKAPTEVKISGGDKIEGLFAPFSTALPGLYRYLLDVVLIGEDGQELAGDDDDDDDSTPIVDIFIDTDCEDCGDYDFVVPPPAGGNPGSVTGQLELLNSDGDARWQITTTGWDTRIEAAAKGWRGFGEGSARVTLLQSAKEGAPMVLEPTTTVSLDKVTLDFSNDLIFKDGEPANLAYKIHAAWLDEKGTQIGQTEVFDAKAEVSKKRKDGTTIYKPWRFHSDLSEVVGQAWSFEAATDTWLNASAFQYTLTPTDGGPAFKPSTATVKTVSQYVQKGSARDVTLGGILKADHYWTFQARLLDANGKALGASSIVTAEAIMDDGEGLVIGGGDTCKAAPLNCIPGLRVRYSDKPDETDPYRVWVTSTRFRTSALATTLELTLIPEKSTGPSLKQSGQEKSGYLLLSTDTSQVIFESNLSVLFPPGSDEDGPFNYDFRLGWLDANGKLLAAEETGSLQLKPKGSGNGKYWAVYCAREYSWSGFRPLN